MSATRAGQALRDRVTQAWRDLEQVTAAGFTDEECDQAMRLLARIEANLTTAPSATDSVDRPSATP